MRGHSMSMIQINTLQVMRRADTTASPLPYDAMIDTQIDEVFRLFVKPEKKALLETVGPNGEYLGDSPEGRCVNPGHAIETAWFIMAEGKQRNDRALVDKALPILEWSLDLGWDPKYGGILYFVDIEGRQPVQYEWDMKLFWPHNEAIYAALLAYDLTGDPKWERWFEKILSWSMDRFPDQAVRRVVRLPAQGRHRVARPEGQHVEGPVPHSAPAPVLPPPAGGDAEEGLSAQSPPSERASV